MSYGESDNVGPGFEDPRDSLVFHKEKVIKFVTVKRPPGWRRAVVGVPHGQQMPALSKCSDMISARTGAKGISRLLAALPTRVG